MRGTHNNHSSSPPFTVSVNVSHIPRVFNDPQPPSQVEGNVELQMQAHTSNLSSCTSAGWNHLEHMGVQCALHALLKWMQLMLLFLAAAA